ncbi:sodium/hydrogen exchanger 9B2-like isoform X2 [Bacillus rossius redtenbacheri]|uniref:sodium/hydrogen exchanger 9B2-like isoform X2 n=1 Tax=Bacillus rossius redtenbacheri TaxID=93214 RepID=UPI002FDD5704
MNEGETTVFLEKNIGDVNEKFATDLDPKCTPIVNDTNGAVLPAVLQDAGKKKCSRWRQAAEARWPRLSQPVFLAVALLAAWGAGYCLLGQPLSPRDGPLFNLCLMFVLAQAAGRLAGLARLPPLLGMIAVGVALRNSGFLQLQGSYAHLAAVLRKVALVVILTRAGLGLDPAALRRLSGMVVRLAVIPSLAEIAVIGVLSHFLLDLPWLWGFMLGGVLAAVSPAVVIPCLFHLAARGYGVDKGVPTLIVAAASFDDIIAIAVFGVMVSVIFSTGSLTMQIIRGPAGLVMGLAFGVLWGVMARYVPSERASWLVGSRTVLLACGGLLAVLGAEAVGFDGAGPLGCITAAFVSCGGWRAGGWSDDHNPVGDNFSLLWQFLQPVLFSLIGTEIDLFVLEGRTVGLGLACLLIALLAKLLLSLASAMGGNLNWKEKLFVSIAWFPKATVQAALGPVALDMARAAQSPESVAHADKVLVVAVLAILLTAPLGAVLITLLGPRLLSRADNPAQTAELARGH